MCRFPLPKGIVIRLPTSSHEGEVTVQCWILLLEGKCGFCLRVISRCAAADLREGFVLQHSAVVAGRPQSDLFGCAGPRDPQGYREFIATDVGLKTWMHLAKLCRELPKGHADLDFLADPVRGEEVGGVKRLGCTFIEPLECKEPRGLAGAVRPRRGVTPSNCKDASLMLRRFLTASREIRIVNL